HHRDLHSFPTRRSSDLTIIRFLYGRPLETLLATWGLSLILQQAVRTIFGPTNKEVGNPSWMSGAFDFGGITITYNRLWIICFTRSEEHTSELQSLTNLV